VVHWDTSDALCHTIHATSKRTSGWVKRIRARAISTVRFVPTRIVFESIPEGLVREWFNRVWKFSNAGFVDRVVQRKHRRRVAPVQHRVRALQGPNRRRVEKGRNANPLVLDVRRVVNRMTGERLHREVEEPPRALSLRAAVRQADLAVRARVAALRAEATLRGAVAAVAAVAAVRPVAMRARNRKHHASLAERPIRRAVVHRSPQPSPKEIDSRQISWWWH
jgi:hypothetical protein